MSDAKERVILYKPGHHGGQCHKEPKHKETALDPIYKFDKSGPCLMSPHFLSGNQKKNVYQIGMTSRRTQYKQVMLLWPRNSWGTNSVFPMDKVAWGQTEALPGKEEGPTGSEEILVVTE